MWETHIFLHWMYTFLWFRLGHSPILIQWTCWPHLKMLVNVGYFTRPNCMKILQLHKIPPRYSCNISSWSLIFSEPQWKRVVLLKQVVIESEGGFKDNYHDLPGHSDSRCCEYHEPVLHQSPEDSNEKDSVLNLSHLSGILHDAVLSLVFVREETTGAQILQHHYQVQPNDGKHASFISLLYIKDSICFVGLSICLFP